MSGIVSKIADTIAASRAVTGNLCLFLIGRLLYPGAPPARARRILVVRHGYIGDLLVTIPALQHLREREETRVKIALLTHPTARSASGAASPAAELLKEWGFLDEIIYSTTRLGSPIRKAIEGFEPDRVVFMPFSSTPWISQAFQLVRLRLLGVKVRPEGFFLGSTPAWLRKLQSDAGVPRHQVVTALNSVGVSTPDAHRRRNPPIPVLHAERERALASLNGARRRPLILLGCSAKFWHKRWPATSYREVLDRIASRYEVTWILVGTSDDAQIADEVVRDSRAATVNLCGKLSLGEAAEVARACSLYLGNDTGLAHICAALDLPTVTLFSGIHPPGVWDPWSRNSVTLRADVPCQGCGAEYSCPTGDKRCLTSITPDIVVNAVERFLSQWVLANRSSGMASTFSVGMPVLSEEN